MGAVSSFIGDFLNNIYRPNVEFSDIAEILIIAFFLYHIISVSYTHLTLPTNREV